MVIVTSGSTSYGSISISIFYPKRPLEREQTAIVTDAKEICQTQVKNDSGA
jgi:hypothetical protein